MSSNTFIVRIPSAGVPRELKDEIQGVLAELAGHRSHKETRVKIDSRDTPLMRHSDLYQVWSPF